MNLLLLRIHELGSLCYARFVLGVLGEKKIKTEYFMFNLWYGLIGLNTFQYSLTFSFFFFFGFYKVKEFIS